MIERCTSVGHKGWLSLRQEFWPDCTREEHVAEMAAFLREPARYAQFVSYSGEGEPLGLAEASVRSDYVNGTESSPVAFLEGIYVAPESRHRGVASALVAAVSEWAIRAGCRELASDALLENESSHSLHRALGMVETERVVYFRKPLPGTNPDAATMEAVLDERDSGPPSGPVG